MIKLRNNIFFINQQGAKIRWAFNDEPFYSDNPRCVAFVDANNSEWEMLFRFDENN